MGLYSVELIIGRIFASEFVGGLFSGRLIYLFIFFFLVGGGRLIIGILRYTGKLRPKGIKRGTSFRLEVYKEVGISQAEV